MILLNPLLTNESYENINCLQGYECKKAIQMLKNLAISKSSTEYRTNLAIFKEFATDGFLEYFKIHESKKEKWVVCFMKEKIFTRTNMHIESWHKVLKYSYLSGKKNKRADKLIAVLIKASKDQDYKQNIMKNKGTTTTFTRKTSERHNSLKNLKMVLADNQTVQVIY